MFYQVKDNLPELMQSDFTAVSAPINIFDGTLTDRWLKFLGRSEKTVETYSRALKQLLNYLHSNNISRPARADLENFRNMLIDSGKAANTVQLYLTVTKLFFRFLAQEGIYKNIADHLQNGVKIDTNHKRGALDNQQSADLLAAVKGSSLLAKLHRALIATMLTTGVRTIELQRANVGDLKSYGGQYWLYVQGKGRSTKSDSVLIPPQVCKVLKEYLDARGNVKKNDPLFTSCSRRNCGARISTLTIRRIAKKYLRQIGIDDKAFSAHSLRHTALTAMLMAGEPLESVQIVARHKNIGTTQIYNHAVQRLKIAAETKVANAIFSRLNI